MSQTTLPFNDDLMMLAIPMSLASVIFQSLEEASMQEMVQGPAADDRRRRAAKAFDDALMSAQVAQKCPSCGIATSTLHRGVCRPCEVKLDALSLRGARELADADQNATAGIPTLLYGQVVRPQVDGDHT